MNIKYSVLIKALCYDFGPIIIIYTNTFPETLQDKRLAINRFTDNIVAVHSEDELNKVLNMCLDD